MKPEIRPISVTIVDLLGALLPGTIWLFLFITFGELFQALIFRSPDTVTITVLSVILKITENKNISFFIVLLMISFCIGFSMKLLVLGMAEKFCAWFLYIWDGRKREFKTYLFPYTEEYKDEKYYKYIVRFLNNTFSFENKSKKEATDEEPLVTLPQVRTQPFSTCKRILKVLNPPLWEETESREAAVRMLGSTLLAAIFNLFCASLSVFINPWPLSISWIAASLLIVVFLAFAYRKARKSEVVYVYMNLLVALKISESPSPKKQNG